jgi:hypothetical protein
MNYPVDNYGRDIEMREFYESHREFYDKIPKLVFPQYRYPVTKVFKVNIRTGKREYKGYY